jgi:hypothetical protein
MCLHSWGKSARVYLEDYDSDVLYINGNKGRTGSLYNNADNIPADF